MYVTIITSVTALLTAIITWIFSPIIKHYLDKKSEKPLSIKSADIHEHPFFWEIDYMIKVTVPKLCISNDCLKSKMLRRFLRIKFKTVFNYYQKLAIKISFNEKVDPKEYINIITNIVKDYELEAIEQHVPEIFIRKFSEWHTPKIMILQDLIEYISHTDVYHNDSEKLSAILSSILMTLHFTLMDAVKVTNSMNGELSVELEKMKKHYE